MSSSSEGGDVVSDDVLFKILLYLPAESLIRFRYVCKYWFNLITDPRFAQMHIHHHHTLSTNATIDNLPTIFCTSSSIQSIPNHNLYSLNNSNVPSSSSKNKEAAIVEIVYPFKSPSSQLKILGSCNGLLCIHVVNYDDFTYTSYVPAARKTFYLRKTVYLKGILCLWNPTTNEFKEVPAAPIDEADEYSKVKVTYGFGYDRVINDYKVVRLVTFRNLSSELKVYTLGTNSWGRVDKVIPYNLLDQSMEVGLYVDGGLHWISNGYGTTIIYSFNIEDEEFREVHVPKLDCSMFRARLQVMNGCLCIFNSYIDRNLKYVHEVWMMMDYGVKESWTRLFRDTTGIESFANLKPLWICKDGQVLSGMDGFYFSEHLVIYDPDNNKFEPIGIQAIPFNWRNAIVHIGSLVSLKSGTYVGQEQQLTQGSRRKTRKLNEKNKTTKESLMENF